MKLNEFSCRQCASKFGFEFKPIKRRQTNLLSLVDLFEKNDFVVDIKTKYFLLLKKDFLECTLFNDLRLMVKNTASKETAEKLAKNIFDLIE